MPGAQPASIHPTRTMAITQIAVYDAVNGIVGRAGPLVVDVRGPRRASADAAAAAAARTALDALLPSQQPAIDAFFASSLAQLGFGRARRARHPLRHGWPTPSSPPAPMTARTRLPPVFAPRHGPRGVPADAAAFAPAGFTQTAHVTPFVLRSASQFRPAPPPALTSPAVRDRLRRGACARRAEQHDAHGRSDGDRAVLGRGPIWIVWNQIADQAAAGFGNSLTQNARLFALLDTTLADGAIALYDAKYAYPSVAPDHGDHRAGSGQPEHDRRSELAAAGQHGQ